MDRVELINKMHQMQGVRLDVGEGNQTYILKDSAVKLVQDLRVTSSRYEKICIPQYIAEYIEKCKENDDISLFLAIRRGCSGSPEYITIDRRVRKWFMTGGDACIEKFARAWVNGYIVEEEPKYYVIDKEGNILLIRGYDGIEQANNLKIAKSGGGALKLTEKEIKDFDPMYWPFRKTVGEVEKNDYN